MMSLVDYASSSDDDVLEPEAEQQPKEQSREPPKPRLQPPIQLPQPWPGSQNTTNSRNQNQQQSENFGNTMPSGVERLPDASLLLSSPLVSANLMNASDHSTRVAAAMEENASRKRDSNGLASSATRGKVPRSNVPHSRIIPETVGGRLVPPQLSGRKNVVTEDIGKLFVKRLPDSTPH